MGQKCKRKKKLRIQIEVGPRKLIVRVKKQEESPSNTSDQSTNWQEQESVLHSPRGVFQQTNGSSSPICSAPRSCLVCYFSSKLFALGVAIHDTCRVVF
ncbi:hypothetical protein L484_002155 [Morus notabilis]|uniref:Uncharacterized protein n=1 Tax=Morus notabilis TaxID=981085 RepID=W9RTJ0_9ROSA|nr:hypothetical protein L484_002155 [Morus notabilis]